MTATLATVSVATASIGTAYPVIISSPATNLTPIPAPTITFATPIPPLPSGASPTELKYQMLAQFPNLFFCDPDFYPVARADETDLARQRFPELQANAEEFQAILKHNGLNELSAFTDEQKLLIYRDHKKLSAISFDLSGDGYEFRLEIAEDEKGFIITGRIDRHGSITVEHQDPTIATCPICLAADTRIDTPNGRVAVRDLHVGDAVWTATAEGMRLKATILKTVRVFVPASHRMIHLVLNDGRELWASPGHPTTDGRMMDNLEIGDLLDGAPITRIERVSYDQPATYDLLPSGDTGFYWANGILIGSTLMDP